MIQQTSALNFVSWTKISTEEFMTVDWKHMCDSWNHLKRIFAKFVFGQEKVASFKDENELVSHEKLLQGSFQICEDGDDKQTNLH